MAANTLLNFTLQARDWKLIIGLVHGTTENDLENMEKAFIDYQQGPAGIVNGNTTVVMQVKEKTLVKIMTHLYGATTRYVYKDTGGGTPISRIMAAIRAAALASFNAVPADPWLTNKVSEQDTFNDGQADMIRTNGANYTQVEEDTTDN